MQHRALHLQVVDHPLRQLDGDIFSLRVVEPHQALAGLGVLGAEGDDHILVVLVVEGEIILLLAELGRSDHGLSLDPGVEGGDPLQDPVSLLILLPSPALLTSRFL